MSQSSAAPKLKFALGSLLVLAALAPAACAPQTPAVSPATSTVRAAAPGGAPTSDVATVLESDPRYSDFVTLIGAAGLWEQLRGATGVTIFAPTNDAFDRTDPNWASLANLSLADQNGTTTFAREHLLEAGAVRGIYPPEAFAGKRQNVMTLGGTVFEADGTVPGHISLSVLHAAAPVGLGYPAAAPQHLANLGTPALATNGIVYPADAVIVH